MPALLHLLTAACFSRLCAAAAASTTTNNSSALDAARTICAGPWDTTHLNNGPMLMQKADCISAFLSDFTSTYAVYQSQGRVEFYDERGASAAAPRLRGVGGDDNAIFRLPWKVRHGSCTIITTMRETIALPINGESMRTMFPNPRGPASMQDEDVDTFVELYNGVTVMLGACILEPALPRAGFAIAGRDRRIGIMVVGTGSRADVDVGEGEMRSGDGRVDVD